MNLFSMFVGWQCGIPIRISESISMAHSADKKTILKNILKPFSKMFATNFMANKSAKSLQELAQCGLIKS